jgi:probable rRNA maturation factor
MVKLAKVELDLQVSEKSEEPPSRDEFQQWVDLALIEDKTAQVSIRIVDEAESQSLNSEYRSKDKPTNVLSFPMELPEEISRELDVTVLGDLAICLPIVEKEAKQQSKSLKAHWAHIVIHGMLHLQGYDHLSDADAEEMEAIEIKLLKKIGIDNPYLETT